jgi:hypothetical protein
MMLLPGIFIYQTKASRNPAKANSIKMGDIPSIKIEHEKDKK